MENNDRTAAGDGCIERLADSAISRRGFLKLLGGALSLLLLPGAKGRRAFAAAGKTLEPRAGRKAVAECSLAVVRGEDPALITRRAVEALGGMPRFVKRGDVVVVKPNIGWDRTPEQAANTNPEVVAEVVRLALDAGARTVKVFDNPCNDGRRTYRNSGIEAAVRKAGGTVYYVDSWKFYPGRFPKGSLMAEWPVFRDAVECDCFINVPIAKHHGLTRLTLSLKNLMGVCGGGRGGMHQNIDKKLCEVAAFIKPDLTIIDAYRVLLRGGPTGGNLRDVEKKATVIAGTDPVLADAYAVTLFGLKPDAIGHIRAAAQAGLGSMDIARAVIREIRV